jgi:putative permease|tara:strand:- start:408 stop:1481 length:1074 start_codon:yes stop_codon:yes gene_type:complete
MSLPIFFKTQNAYTQTIKLFACMIAIVLAGFYLLSAVIIPIVISLTLYAIFEPATLYLVRHNVNHSLSIIIVLVFLVFFSFIAIGFALPQLIEQIGLLQAKLPAIFSKLEGFLTHYSAEFSDQIGVDLDVSDMIVSTVSQSTLLGQSFLLNFSNKLLGVTIVFLLVPFLTYYLLKDFRSLRNHMMNWLPNTSFELGWLIYHRVSKQLQAYTRGVMIQSIIMSLVCMTGFSLIGLDIPILLGVITGILNLVPYIGPVISILLSLLVSSAMTPFDPSLLYLGVLVIVIAQIIDNVIVIPAVIANAVNLHPVQVILGIIIFGNLFGTLGVILAIPAIATAKIIFNNLYADILNENQKQSL